MKLNEYKILNLFKVHALTMNGAITGSFYPILRFIIPIFMSNVIADKNVLLGAAEELEEGLLLNILRDE